MTDPTPSPASAHQRTVELLPWLVNGSLEAGERQAVESHLADCSDCRDELIATRDAFEVYAAHLPTEALITYAENPEVGGYSVLGEGGRSHAVDRRLIERHLEQCAACREEVHLTRESLAGLTATAGAGAATATTAPSVAPLIQPTPHTASELDGDAWRAAPMGPAAGGAPRWFPLALAASLVFAIVAAGGWYLAHQRVDEGQRQLARVQKDLAAAEVAVAEARQTVGIAPDPTAAEADLRRHETELNGLQAELADLSSRLESEQEQVAALQEKAGAPLPVVISNGIPVALMLDRVRGDSEPEEPIQAEVGRSLAFTILDDSGLLSEGSDVSYRVLTADGTTVTEGSLTPWRTSDGYLSLQLTILDPGRLPSGPLALQVLRGNEELNRYPFRSP